MKNNQTICSAEVIQLLKDKKLLPEDDENEVSHIMVVDYIMENFKIGISKNYNYEAMETALLHTLKNLI